MTARALVAVAALAACDPGGGIVTRAQAITREAVLGIAPTPIAGYCASACTMRLRDACVMPGTVFLFHAPEPDLPRHRMLMAAHYPEPLATWFLSGMTGPRFMSGAEAITLGATPCEGSIP